MFQTLKHDPDDEVATVSGALQMALVVRLQIFSVEKVEPAAAEFLSEFSERLDKVPARRHAVDFESAKAWAWWQGERTNELVALGLATQAADTEIQRLNMVEAVESIVFECFADEALRNLIHERRADLELQIQSLRNNRLNVQ